MDDTQFDHLTLSLSGTASRRRMLATLATGLVGLATNDGSVQAGPSCKNVGNRCKRAKQCCSGICQGKKGKKRCKAHDTGGCRAGQHPASCGGGSTVSCTTSGGHDGICATTTGNAGYCFGSGLICTTCQKDADCRQFCGETAACIPCAEACVTTDTACVCAKDFE